MKPLSWLLGLALGLAALAELAAITAPHNPYDSIPTRCGPRLRDVCKPTGINWSR